MSALTCALERTPFWCHGHDRPCAGWLALRAPADELRDAPWDHPAGADLD